MVIWSSALAVLLQKYWAETGAMKKVDKHIILKQWEKKQQEAHYVDHCLNEWTHMLARISPQRGQIIVKLGPESEELAIALAKSVNPTGSVITLNDSVRNIRNFIARSCRAGIANIEPVLLDRPHFQTTKFPLADKQADTITSLGTLHRFIPNKELLFKEVFRILKSGGQFILADIAPGTAAEKYITRFVQPLLKGNYLSDFLSPTDIKQLCKKSGLKLKHWRVDYVPQIFETQRQMAKFLRSRYGLSCPSSNVLRAAHQYLGFHKLGKQVVLNWELAFSVIVKP